MHVLFINGLVIVRENANLKSSRIYFFDFFVLEIAGDNFISHHNNVHK